MQIPRGGLVTVDALDRLARRSPLSPSASGPPGPLTSGTLGSSASGPLVEVLPGLLASREARPHWLQSIEEGVRPTCTTALAAEGIWVPRLPESTFHGYGRRSSRSDAPTGTVPHGWHHGWPEDAPFASIRLALEHAIRCRDAETTLVMAESALNQRLLSLADWKALVAGAPVKKQRLLRKARLDAQSGSETRVRLGFESRRIRVESQVFVPGVGHVDLLVAGVLVIECDSHAHHSSREDQKRDRRRDLELLRRGYIVIRLSYSQIWESWPETLEHLIAAHRSVRDRRLRPWELGA